MLIKCVTFNYKTTEHEGGPLSFLSLQQKDSPAELTIWILSSDLEPDWRLWDFQDPVW